LVGGSTGAWCKGPYSHVTSLSFSLQRNGLATRNDLRRDGRNGEMVCSKSKANLKGKKRRMDGRTGKGEAYGRINRVTIGMKGQEEGIL
jgi:hypothetical protein